MVTNPLEQHPQWSSVLFIHRKLKSQGFQTLVAGGAVRDFLLKRPVSDIDLVTQATPDQVEKLFEKTVMVGRQFGVSRVVLDDHDIEVATFRRDGAYRDGRRPESVEFSSVKEDARRRDFTINALFYDLDNGEIIDYVGGKQDLKEKRIRCVGDPRRRFHEDKLRILRTLRFHAQLGFSIEEQTFKAIGEYVPMMVDQVSMERIRDEWEKILCSKYRLSCMEKLRELGLWQILFPHWDFCFSMYQRVLGPVSKQEGKLPNLQSVDLKSYSISKQENLHQTGGEYSVSEPIFGEGGKSLYDPICRQFLKPNSLEPDRSWILWFLLHGPKSKEELVSWIRPWKLSGPLQKKILFCYRSLDLLEKEKALEPVDYALFLNEDHGFLALNIYGHLCPQSTKTDFFQKIQKALTFFKEGCLPEPLVKGEDLLQMGVKAGPRVAKILKKLYRRQLQEKILEKGILLDSGIHKI